MKRCKTLFYKTTSWFLWTKTHTGKCQGCLAWHMLTERVNKRQSWKEGEEKPTSVLVGKKNLKKKQISKPMAVGSMVHGDRKWKRKRFWQGVLVGVAVWAEGWGWRCVCVRAYAHMDVCICVLCASEGTCVCMCFVDRDWWGKARCSRGGRHLVVCQSTVWEMTAICIEECMQRSSQWGGTVFRWRVGWFPTD